MPTWIAVCPTSEIDPDDLIPFSFDGVDYAVYRSNRDEYYATAAYCTHEQTLLCDGLVTNGIIECPKHNGRFDYRTGRAMGAPAIVDLQTFPTKVDGDTVYLDIDRR